ncbi:MAG: diacylglycerol/lipid kinase family protein [Alphaproteobacteria bacterium]
MKARILFNRGGGSADRRADAERALAAAGLNAEPEWLDGGDLAKAAEEAVKAGAELVVAGGGDGTISAVAGALAGTKAKLGILPLGTLNHFARDLGIPLDLDKAARLIATGKSRSVDVAEVNGRVFINNSAIGLYPLMVIDREAQESRLGRSKRWAMLVASARTLVRFSSERLTLTVNDLKARVQTPLLFVGNNLYRLEMPGAGTRERLDRGELFVLVLRRKSRFGFCIASLRALIGRTRSEDAVRIENVSALRVDSSRSRLAVSLDGETAHLKTPLDYRLRPKALKVIAP